MTPTHQSDPRVAVLYLCAGIGCTLATLLAWWVL